MSHDVIGAYLAVGWLAVGKHAEGKVGGTKLLGLVL